MKEPIIITVSIFIVFFIALHLDSIFIGGTIAYYLPASLLETGMFIAGLFVGKNINKITGG